jgi:hypothetical protein
MTDHIYEADENFNFDQIIAKKPVSQSGGSFLIKFTKNDIPLYIQTPKCSIKQRSELKPGKKQTYCDLVFLQENEGFTQWMENLEQFSQQTIFKNKSQWFQTELELEDIENSFTSPMKSYKSGKSYIVRTNIPNILGKNTLKIYDEDENAIEIENISETMQVITILEVQGIRCSSRSFQIELEIKQMMVLKPVNLFDKCILKSRALPMVNPVSSQNINEEKPLMDRISDSSPVSTSNFDIMNHEYPSLDLESSLGKNSENSIEIGETVSENTMNDLPPIEESDSIKIETVEEENPDILKEVEFDLEKIGEEEKVTLRQRNDVYYEMYKEARRKAKIARDLALSSYLEAKRIKNTYMLDDIIDSDESDEEEEEDDSDDEDADN